MPGRTPPTSQLDWLSSTTAMIVLLWSRATRDLLRSFGWGIAVLHRLDAATKLPPPRRPPHRIFESLHGKLAEPRIKTGLSALGGANRYHRRRRITAGSMATDGAGIKHRILSTRSQRQRFNGLRPGRRTRRTGAVKSESTEAVTLRRPAFIS